MVFIFTRKIGVLQIMMLMSAIMVFSISTIEPLYVLLIVLNAEFLTFFASQTNVVFKVQL